jgi:heparosan-N-sulfate-glucuronate 5-epimerase
VFANKFFLFLFSFIVSLVVISYKGDEWEQPVRTALYNIINDSVPVYSAEYVDEKGIPYVDYKTLNGVTAGKQYNATIVCNYALDYYNAFQKLGDSALLLNFFHCTGWLAAHFAVKGDHASYIFNWRQPWYDSVGVPYTSGMTSGLAIKVFVFAYRLTGNSEYLNHAELLMRGYYVPIQTGGFTYRDKDGWWYEELADSFMHTPRILDGHIFAVTGLHSLTEATQNDSAVYLFRKGVAALKNRLPSYDIGNGWSFYDAYHLPADRKYHHILTGQMKELYELTKDESFAKYYRKWRRPLDRWYIRKIIEDRNVSGAMLFMITCLCGFIALNIFRRVLKVRKA